MLARKLKVGDRIVVGGFPATVTETRQNSGVTWFQWDDAKRGASCFIAWFADGSFNQLAEHL